MSQIDCYLGLLEETHNRIPRAFMGLRYVYDGKTKAFQAHRPNLKARVSINAALVVIIMFASP